jgi:hypothetical protein
MKEEAGIVHQLLNSLQPYPAMRFMLFAGKWGDIESVISDFCAENGHDLLVYTLKKDLEHAIVGGTHLRIKPYRREQKRYNLQGRVYDYVFVTDEIPDTEDFGNKIYSAIANAGRLYLLLEKNRKADYFEWEQRLDKNNYVSINPIELSDSCLFVSAKKMHGWGG